MDLNNWILSEVDFDAEDWYYECLPDMGIISREYCDMIFESQRFEHLDNTDCPKCGYFGRNYFIENKKHPAFRYKCKKCRHKFSMRSGTYLDNSKLENVYWYRLAFLISNLKFPINSHALAKSLGLTQKTTYGMLITIKSAMKLKDIGCVSGINYSIPKDVDWWKVIESLLKLNSEQNYFTPRSTLKEIEEVKKKPYKFSK